MCTGTMVLSHWLRRVLIPMMHSQSMKCRDLGATHLQHLRRLMPCQYRRLLARRYRSKQEHEQSKHKAYYG